MRFCDSTASLSAAICAWTIVSSGTPFFSSAAAGQTSHARTTPESAVMDLRVNFVIAVSFRLRMLTNRPQPDSPLCFWSSSSMCLSHASDIGRAFSERRDFANQVRASPSFPAL